MPVVLVYSIMSFYYSYKLTHMYYNWPGTVRVPAPCQYAHKVSPVFCIVLFCIVSPFCP